MSVLFFNTNYEKIFLSYIGKFWKLGETMIGNKELMEEYNIFSNNVRFYRKKMHYTQETLAEKADISISYIKQIESGKEYKNISLSVMQKLAKVLGVNVKALFTTENEI